MLQHILTMKTHLYLSALVLFFSFSVARAQNKKEQIVLLNQTIDSLKQVVQNKDLDLSEFSAKLSTNEKKVDSLSNISLAQKKELASLNDQLNLQKKTNTEMIERNEKKEKENIFTIEQLQRRYTSLLDSVKNVPKTPALKNIFHSSDFPIPYTFDGNYQFDFIPSDGDNISVTSTDFNGLFTSYYPKSWNEAYGKNGKDIIYAKGNYKNGLKEGHWVYYLCDGNKQYEGDYKNGVKVGIWKNYDFCHENFNFSGNQSNYGFLTTIYTLMDYYQFGEDKAWDFVSENVQFTNNIPGDTLYLVDALNTVKLKISWRDSTVMYGNGRMVSNSKRFLDCPFDVNQLKDGEFDVYSSTGQIVYKLSKSGDVIKEFHFDSSGQIKAKNEYFKGEGKIINYDRSGKITDQYENTFGTGKYGPECPCQ